MLEKVITDIPMAKPPITHTASGPQTSLPVQTTLYKQAGSQSIEKALDKNKAGMSHSSVIV